jgi:hypothetical protein
MSRESEARNKTPKLAHRVMAILEFLADTIPDAQNISPLFWNELNTSNGASLTIPLSYLYTNMYIFSGCCTKFAKKCGDLHGEAACRAFSL